LNPDKGQMETSGTIPFPSRSFRYRIPVVVIFDWYLNQVSHEVKMKVIDSATTTRALIKLIKNAWNETMILLLWVFIFFELPLFNGVCRLLRKSKRLLSKGGVNLVFLIENQLQLTIFL
jgi:hypothetical protein